jgi:SAM-dependent methyltransferase
MSSCPTATVTAVELYGAELRRALLDAERPVRLRAVGERGEQLTLALDRYLGPALAEDEAVLRRAAGPVLDVGCGPGRHVLALAHRGAVAVGVDISPIAVAMARRRGAIVIEASVFDRLPGTGRWGSALLLDGNIGIGGRPAELLARVRALLRPAGLALVEIGGPGQPTEALRVRLAARGLASEWFPWARVGVDDLASIAHRAGFEIDDCWRAGDRWFAALASPAATPAHAR